MDVISDRGIHAGNAVEELAGPAFMDMLRDAAHRDIDAGNARWWPGRQPLTACFTGSLELNGVRFEYLHSPNAVPPCPIWIHDAEVVSYHETQPKGKRHLSAAWTRVGA